MGHHIFQDLYHTGFDIDLDFGKTGLKVGAVGQGLMRPFNHDVIPVLSVLINGIMGYFAQSDVFFRIRLHIDPALLDIELASGNIQLF